MSGWLFKKKPIAALVIRGLCVWEFSFIYPGTEKVVSCSYAGTMSRTNCKETVFLKRRYAGMKGELI